MSCTGSKQQEFLLCEVKTHTVNNAACSPSLLIICTCSVWFSLCGLHSCQGIQFNLQYHMLSPGCAVRKAQWGKPTPATIFAASMRV